MHCSYAMNQLLSLLVFPLFLFTSFFFLFPFAFPFSSPSLLPSLPSLFVPPSPPSTPTGAVYYGADNTAIRSGRGESNQPDSSGNLVEIRNQYQGGQSCAQSGWSQLVCSITGVLCVLECYLYTQYAQTCIVQL